MKNNIIQKYIPLGVKINNYGNLFAYEMSPQDIVSVCCKLYKEHKLPLKIITAFDERDKNGNFKIMYVFGIPGENIFLAPFILTKSEFSSLVHEIHEATSYERRIRTFFGLEPKGHPDLRPLILHENWPGDVYPLRKDFDWNERPKIANGKYEFKKIEGEGVYEVPVGPVHAGIIEPGHFRFSMAGEEILNLESRLGYQHKGSEKLFETIPLSEKIKLSERISGDSSFSHSLAFCQTLEILAEIELLERVKYLRVIFAELERLANHFGDIGAIMTDTGFNFGGAQGGRLREMIMQINESLTGSRFLRGVNMIGGISKDIKNESLLEIEKKLKAIEKDFSEAIEIAKNSKTLFNRLKDTGQLDIDIARDHGVVGVSARAIGISVDARKDHPYAAYDKLNPKISIEFGGDVLSRFNVRIKEVFSSFELIKKAVREIIKYKEENILTEIKFKKNSYAISVVEGWRGDIVYLVSTDKEGNIDRVDVRDPSFLNWPAVGYAGKGNMIPDFPLINKSFNLSYSGNDL